MILISIYVPVLLYALLAPINIWRHTYVAFHLNAHILPTNKEALTTPYCVTQLFPFVAIAESTHICVGSNWVGKLPFSRTRAGEIHKTKGSLFQTFD